MQISFGKFIPVNVYLDGKPANSEETDKITTNLCRILRNDSNSEKTFLAEQQRRFFGAMVSDYRIPKKTFKRGATDSSDVTTVNIKNKGRYLVTGAHIDVKNQYGRDFYEMMCSETDKYIQMGLTDEETARNVAESKAKENRQNKLKNILKSGLLGKVLCINAVKVPDQKTDKDTYRIGLIDFQGRG